MTDTPVSLTRLLAVARKEMIQLRRDRRSMIFAFVLPLVLLVIFGYAISWDVKNIAAAVLDYDNSSSSRELIDSLESSGYFTVAARVSRPEEYERLIDQGAVMIAFTIPSGFARDLRGGEVATMQAVADGSDANTATIALGYAQAVIFNFSTRVLMGHRVQMPLVAQTRVWYNEELSSRNMIVPGLVAVIMSIIAAILTSLTIAREWERGTMEQLASTPVSRFEIVVGKLLPYIGIGLIDIGLITVAGVLLFRVPFRGSVLLLFALSFLFLVGALGVGIFISAAARSQLVATQAAMVTTYLPSFLLSGFMYAIEAMPAPLRAITYLVPARYFLVVTRGIFLKGVGVEVLRLQAWLMIAFAVSGLGLAMWRFRKEIE
jgi:ABC-2 type transport system permease protein